MNYPPCIEKKIDEDNIVWWVPTNLPHNIHEYTEETIQCYV